METHPRKKSVDGREPILPHVRHVILKAPASPVMLQSIPIRPGFPGTANHWHEKAIAPAPNVTGEMWKSAVARIAVTLLSNCPLLRGAHLMATFSVNRGEFSMKRIIILMMAMVLWPKPGIALAHGVGSVGFGIRQRKNARSFVEDYKSNPEAVDRKAEADEYLQNRRRTTVKTAIFGSYLATISAVLLTNAVLQTVREKRGDAREDIRIWPYYLTGGLLLAAGVGIIFSARKKLNDLDGLESTSVDTAATPGISPFWNTENGNAVFGISMNHLF
jgi:hypothetical protein